MDTCLLTGSPQTSRHRRRRHRGAFAVASAAALLAVLSALAWASSASAVVKWSMIMEGRGWGHGIGMSQYGADGYALHGWKYDAIIKHYYTGVTLGKVANVPVRVLLRSGRSSIVATDAAQFKAAWTAKTVHIAGGVTATVTWSGGSYHLTAGGSSWVAATPITFVAETSKLRLLTPNDNGVVGRYRGTLRVVHFTDGLEVVNKLPLESYLLGVVPRESPSSWPIEALKAQAVAARSYAFRETGGSGSFDVYCTTASQMYGGADAEATSTDKAVTATKGIVPDYLFNKKPTPIVAFFFSTSGGHTENIENVWSGAAAQPYLKGVPDPYDTTSPYHIWPDNPIHRTPAAIAGALGFTKGPLRAVYVVKRGTSPRVIKALLIGSAGAVAVDGATLRADLGLRDCWVYFTSLSINPSTTTTINYGSSVTLTGKRYPRLPTGKTVTLHRRPAGGSWVTRGTTAVAGSLAVTVQSTTYTAKYTAFSAKVTPGVTTQYYFSAPASMTASSVVTSGHVTVDVRPVVTIKASSLTPAVGAAVTFTGTVKPAITGETVWLQTQTSTGWTNAVSTTLASDGSYKVNWTPTAAGTTTLRLRVPASSTLVAGVSPTVAITAS
jgi:stage II sporulation protein D